MTAPTLPSSDTSFAALNESLIGEITIHLTNLVTLSKDVSDKSSTRRVTRTDFLARKTDITGQVYNSLKQYTFELYKKELYDPST